MERMRLFRELVKLHLSQLCRQIPLLAGLLLFCALLPILAGRGAEEALSRGVDFSGVRLAVTAPEGDRVPGLVEEYLGSLSDVREYCEVQAMDYDRALSALEQEEVTAVVVLPKKFIRDVQRGRNPEVRVVVNGQHPLESMLLLWLGESAVDLLSSVQSGIYAALDQYDAAPPEGLSRRQVVRDLNLRYIQWTLNRQDLFQEETLQPIESLPIAKHYQLSLFLFLLLGLAPAFAREFQGSWLRMQRRLRTVGHSPLQGFFAACGALTLLLCALLWIGFWGSGMLPLGLALGAALLCALFVTAFAALCSLLTESAAGCGALSIALSLGALFLAGGLLPPVLLPAGIQRLSGLSPITWLRAVLSGGAGGRMGTAVLWTLLLTAVLLSLAALCFWRRCRREEGTR